MVQRQHQFALKVLSMKLIKLLVRTKEEPPHEVKDFGLGQDLAVLSSFWNFQNTKHLLKHIIHHLEGVNALSIQIPCGQY